jgi:putative Holliday junction resolvase
MTIVALDIGSKRVGVALTPSDVIVPVPVGVWERASAEKQLLSLITERGISIVVVGLPLDRDGNETPQSEKVRKFCARILKRAAKITIVYVDEYLTSEEAKNSGGDLRYIDALAALEILKNYLKEPLKNPCR